MSERSLRAEVLLLVRVAEAHEDWFEEEARTSRNELEGALAAAEAAELLTAERVARLRDLANGVDDEVAGVQLTAEQLASAEALLDELVRDAAADAMSPDATHARVRFNDALQTLTQLGGLDAAAERRWQRRLANPDLDPEDDEDDWEDAEESEPLLQLKAVLPGPPARSGARVTVVECYDGGVFVRWERAREIPKALRDAPHEEVRDYFYERHVTGNDSPAVSDDAGTEYRSQGGGGGIGVRGGRWVTDQAWTFTPGVPPAATKLTVHLAGEDFEFDVSGVAERPGI